MKTIPRSHHRKIAALRKTYTEAVVYSLAYDFITRPVDAVVVWDHYINDGRGKLRERYDGDLQIDVHANLWYVLRDPSPPDEGDVLSVPEVAA